MKFAQHLQNDKVYHQKEGKISYLMVYLVNLSSTCPGPAQFLLDYLLVSVSTVVSLLTKISICVAIQISSSSQFYLQFLD